MTNMLNSSFHGRHRMAQATVAAAGARLRLRARHRAAAVRLALSVAGGAVAAAQRWLPVAYAASPTTYILKPCGAALHVCPVRPSICCVQFVCFATASFFHLYRTLLTTPCLVRGCGISRKRLPQAR